ncbi:biotin transporter BioY [Nereida sp. MMG025]|uniref:biotin transporter BioY n=1 Tax=Nereida sp. MMG025 TaxID=2909981 RepID=UPI001F1B98BF|nr:biotin transporter BioY [Nereida sp. MMG025]MCF6443388.1 biotin transporter BioY [Nereida sp. MMG025]
MSIALNDKALTEAFGPTEGTSLRIKQAILVVLGIAALAIAAKIKIPMFPSPVPITLGTFAVLTIGVTYGPRLGLATIMGYMIIGALGFDVFASSSAEANGISYMMGGTGGYLLGYVAATLYLGYAARRGLDRSIEGMGGALLVANALIYVPGVLWLHQFTSGWAQTMEWGLTPYVIGDLMKLALAALLIPSLWKLVGKARG